MYNFFVRTFRGRADALVGLPTKASGLNAVVRGVFRGSSMVEQLAVNELVVGSIPTRGATGSRYFNRVKTSTCRQDSNSFYFYIFVLKYTQ